MSACEYPLIESLLNGGSVADVRQIVAGPEYFFDRGAARIYGAILEVAAEGKPITSEIVTARLDLRDDLTKAAWLETAGSTRCASGDHAVFFAEEVADAHQQRSARQAVYRLNEADDVTPDDLSAAAERLRAMRPKGSTLHAIKEVTRRALDQIEDAFAARARGETISGIPYGIDRIDASTGGMKKGELVIIGARPSVGKTSMGLSIVNHAAVTSGKRVLFVSLEMTETQDAMRLISIRSGVPFAEVDRGELTKGSAPKVSRAIEEISKSGMMIETKPGLTMPELASQVHAMARDGLELVVIDYLGLMRYPQFSGHDSNYKEVSEISKGLKELALGARLPIIALAQLNRGSAKASRPPRMSDLRDSGSIEQDADIVILLHRDDEVRATYEGADIEPALAIIDKNRNGATGRIRLKFVKRTMSFTDWIGDNWPDSL